MSFMLFAAGVAASFSLAEIVVTADRGCAAYQLKPHRNLTLRTGGELFTLEERGLVVGTVLCVHH
jgi:hypothetical protein